jgi:hypothetical protein
MVFLIVWSGWSVEPGESLHPSPAARLLQRSGRPFQPSRLRLLLHRTINILGMVEQGVKDFLLHRTNRGAGTRPRIPNTQ